MMSDLTQSLQGILSNCEPLIRDAGTFLSDEQQKFKRSDITEKDFNQLVTYVDVETEKQLVKGLSQLLPESSFLTEEKTTVSSASEWVWIIDPLDGTTNFLHHLGCFAISVALKYKSETVLGIVFDPVKNEYFSAIKDGGAYLNHQRIQVSPSDKLSQSLIATGFPYYDFSLINSYCELLKHLMKSTRGIRRFGAAALDLCYVACGRFDAFFEHSLHPWDVAAGALIVQEAGGMVTDFSGGTNYIYAKEIVAGNPSVTPELLNLCTRFLIEIEK